MAKLILNKVLRPMIFQFRIVGLWPSETNSIAYKTYGYFLFIAFSSVLTVTMLTEMVFAGLTASENFTDSMYMSLTEFALFIKIIRFKMRNRSIQRLLENVKNFHLETDDEVNLFNRKLYFIYIILIVNYTMTSVSFWSAFVKCIMSEEVILVFPAHYPIDWQNGGRMFWIVLAHQTTGMVITSNLNAGIDMYPDFLLHICTAQMEVLGKRLQALGYNHDKFKQRHQFNTADGQQKDTLQRLKDCIRLHQQILELSDFKISFPMFILSLFQFRFYCSLVDGVGRDFGISLFGQICVSAMVICALTIQMARVNTLFNRI